MECPESLKSEAFQQRLYHCLALAAAKYGCSELVAELLLAGVRRHEHLADHAPRVALEAEDSYGSNQLVRLGGWVDG